MSEMLITKKDLQEGLQNFEYRFLIKTGFMLAAVVGIIAAIVKL